MERDAFLFQEEDEQKKRMNTVLVNTWRKTEAKITLSKCPMECISIFKRLLISSVSVFMLYLSTPDDDSDNDNDNDNSLQNTYVFMYLCVCMCEIHIWCCWPSFLLLFLFIFMVDGRCPKQPAIRMASSILTSWIAAIFEFHLDFGPIYELVFGLQQLQLFQHAALPFFTAISFTSLAKCKATHKIPDINNITSIVKKKKHFPVCHISFNFRFRFRFRCGNWGSIVWIGITRLRDTKW